MKNWKDNKKKIIGLAGGLLFTVIGTYNSVVINTQSSISDVDYKFVKRLDEVYGVVVPGRVVAASVEWKKLPKHEVVKMERSPIVQAVNTVAASAEPVFVTNETNEPAAAAVQDELELNLVEVVNPRKWAQALQPNQFSGSLSTSNGTIESLSVSLPNGESVSVSFSEMKGNVFEYEHEGELYSGMMYQVDQYSYMITLTNGPMEGTRLRFSTASTEAQLAESQQALAENHNIEAGSFGSENPEAQPESMAQAEEVQPTEGLADQAFNMGQEQGNI